jgi:hypothetical protein
MKEKGETADKHMLEKNMILFLKKNINYLTRFRYTMQEAQIYFIW